MFYFMSCPCVLYDAQWPAALSVFSCSCERCLAAVFVVTEFVCVCVLGLVGGGGGGGGVLQEGSFAGI